MQAARLAAEYADSAREKEAQIAEANSKFVLPTIDSFQRPERPHRPNAGQGAPVPLLHQWGLLHGLADAVQLAVHSMYVHHASSDGLPRGGHGGRMM